VTGWPSSGSHPRPGLYRPRRRLRLSYIEELPEPSPRHPVPTPQQSEGSPLPDAFPVLLTTPQFGATIVSSTWVPDRETLSRNAQRGTCASYITTDRGLRGFASPGGSWRSNR